MEPRPDDVRLAADLVMQAGRLATRMRGEGLESQRKTSVTDIVTSADRAAEELVTSRLEHSRPEDGIIGEEGAYRIGTSGLTWVIDPVDGTFNFASGLGTWCSAIALTRGDDVVLGGVYHPQSDTVWVGGPRVPTTRNGIPVPSIPDRHLHETSLATYLHPTRFSLPDTVEPFLVLVQSAATIRMLGSGSLELAQVASGGLGVYVHHSAPAWDWLPGEALVLGAGGHTETLDHRGYRWHLAGSATAVADAARALRSAAAHS
jgi:fructose-1,6-bisphosphatase/inositol monophosphatase family enzyme